VVSLSLGVAVASLLFAAFVVVRWPAHQFRDELPPPFMPGHPRWQRRLGRLAKNLGAVVLVLAGLIMSLPGVPGQGLLVILIGLSLSDLPGKRGVERRLIARPLVSRTLNSVRARFGRPPLDLGGPGVRESAVL